MKKVTDPVLIEELNRAFDIRKKISSKYEQATQSEKTESPQESEMAQPPSFLQTFGRSALRAGPEALGYLTTKTGITSPETIQNLLYGKGEEGFRRKEEHERGRSAHPIAAFLGDVAGFGPVGGLTSAGIRSIPLASRAIKSASPSLLKRSAVHGIEGAAIGTAFSPPGSEAEGAGIGGLIGGILGGPGISLARNIGDYVRKGRNIANIEELGSQRASAEAANLEQQELIDALKKSYKKQGISASPEEIEHQISQRKEKIRGLEPSANISHEPTENLLNYPTGEELVPNAIKHKSEGIKNIKELISAGTPKDVALDVEAAKEIVNSVENTKRFIQKNYYNPATEYAKNNYVQLPRTPNIKFIEEQLNKFFSDPIAKKSPGFEKLKNEMIKTEKGHDLVKMTDFIEQWKETKNAAAKARSRGFKEGGEDLQYWRDKSDEFKNLADQQLKVLESHLPKELFGKLMEATKLWKEEVIPFRGNKIYEQARKLGRIDVTDIPKELRGQGVGQEKMLETFLSNPKLTKLALGHSHIKNPEKLLEPEPYEHAFIEKLPELQLKLRQLSGHNRAIDIAKAQHELLQSERARTEIGHKEIVSRQKERLKAIKETKKLNDEISDLTKKQDVLEKQLKRGEITEEQYKKSNAKYEETIRNKKNIKKNLKKAFYIGGGIVGYEISKEIKKLME